MTTAQVHRLFRKCFIFLGADQKQQLGSRMAGCTCRPRMLGGRQRSKGGEDHCAYLLAVWPVTCFGAAGACSAFVQYFTDHQDQYNAPEDQFRQLAYNAPAPSGACCAAANQFVGQKCSCDSTLLGNAGQARRPAYVELFLAQGKSWACTRAPVAPAAPPSHVCLRHVCRTDVPWRACAVLGMLLSYSCIVVSITFFCEIPVSN